jgi:hypothetical protein
MHEVGAEKLAMHFLVMRQRINNDQRICLCITAPPFFLIIWLNSSRAASDIPPTDRLGSGVMVARGDGVDQDGEDNCQCKQVWLPSVA